MAEMLWLMSSSSVGAGVIDVLLQAYAAAAHQCRTVSAQNIARFCHLGKLMVRSKLSSPSIQDDQ